MAKKKDPFEDFAEKMLSGPRVSEVATVSDSDIQTVREAAISDASETTPSLPSPTKQEAEKKKYESLIAKKAIVSVFLEQYAGIVVMQITHQDDSFIYGTERNQKIYVKKRLITKIEEL